MRVVEEIIALMRSPNSQDPAVATLSKMVLGLVDCVRECEARTRLAEAELEAEQGKVKEFMAAVWHQCADGRYDDFPSSAPREAAHAVG